MVALSKLIAPSFYDVHKSVSRGAYTHYWLSGGRGSTKSSMVSIEMALQIMQTPHIHGVVMRRYATTLRGSVYEQLLWALDMLGVSSLWKATVNPLKLVYKPTGQSIVFVGADDPLKIKSIKFHDGYPAVIWLEELNEFQDMESVRNLLQSLMRGGPQFSVFYSYNPPISMNSWVNEEAAMAKGNRLTHHSTYLDVPPEWLGEAFIYEAEDLKRRRPDRYEHEYMGVATGTGGEVFRNVERRKITAEERQAFDNQRHGIDFGYAADPFVWLGMHYDKTRRRLYIYDEIYNVGLKLRDAASRINNKGADRCWTICDSEDPRAIDELADHGLRVCGAKKGPGSRDNGIKWLTDLDEIIIDPETCPNAAREFTGYELEPDKKGSFKQKYPKVDDHTIDAARYGCEDDIIGERRYGPIKIRR